MVKKKLNKKIKAVYPSSLICQDFSEGDDNFHGYVLWDISDNSNITYEKIPVESDYSFKTLKVNRFTDFNDLDLYIENPSKYMNIRVIWNTFPSDYTSENISKVSQYIKNKYGNDHKLIHPKDFVVDNEIEIQNNDDLKLENISTKDVQHKIFINHLEEQGYDNNFINDIIELDNEIFERLQINEHESINWRIIKIKGKNFRSYDEIEFDFRNYNGVTQIGGKNRGGKSSIIQLITYILYNNTIETEKQQKNGDNRYINNKRNLDYCNGDCVIEANGEYYGIFRETKRKWNRSKTKITGTPTTVSYYKLSDPDENFSKNNELSEENINLTEDERKITQLKINKIIGDYDNFNRLVLTTADTLNKILSVVKSDFIDNLLYDLGFDIFDKKLEEFKSYKSEYQNNNEKIIIDIDSSKERIKLHEQNIVEIKDKIKQIEQNEIVELNNKIDIGNKFKEDLIKSLNKIDKNLESINPDTINSNIDKYQKEGEGKKNSFLSNKNKIKQLKDKYDSELLENLIKEKDNFKEKIYIEKDEINNKKDEIRIIESNKSKIQTNIYHVNKSIENLIEENKKLEHSKVCPTCNQTLKEKDIVVIKSKIDDNLIKINEHNKSIEDLKNKLPILDIDISNVKEDIQNINDKINNINIEMENILQEIGKLTNDKIEVEERNNLINKNQILKSEMETLSLKIEKENEILKRYNELKIQIIENSKINEKIVKAENRIKELLTNKDELLYNINNLKNEINNINNKIKDINENINKFIKQEKIEILHKTYQSLIHRDGIPTKLLKKYSIPLINNRLNKLLENMSFSVWLDPEDLSLKMADISKTDAIIDCISGSGMERTFSAISFKFCLNELNIKSRPSLIILDEVTGKLVDDSVELFVNLLSVMKKKINNILLIEHVHDIFPDNYVEVVKNENGISKLNIGI